MSVHKTQVTFLSFPSLMSGLKMILRGEGVAKTPIVSKGLRLTPTLASPTPHDHTNIGQKFS